MSLLRRCSTCSPPPRVRRVPVTVRSLSANQTMPAIGQSAFVLGGMRSLSAAQAMPAIAQSAFVLTGQRHLSAAQAVPAIAQVATASVGAVSAAAPLVDTFTAVDGTDPTTRDIDSDAGIPALARWTALAAAGSIESNMWSADGAWQSDLANLADITLGGVGPWTLPPTFFLMFDGLTVGSGTYSGSGAPGLDCFLNSFSGGGLHITLSRHDTSGSNLDLSYTIDTSGGPFTNSGTPDTVSGLGPHRYGAYFSASDVSVIVDGAVIATSSNPGTFPDLSNIELALRGTTAANSTLDEFELLGPAEVADLAAAVALTELGAARHLSATQSVPVVAQTATALTGQRHLSAAQTMPAITQAATVRAGVRHLTATQTMPAATQAATALTGSRHLSSAQAMPVIGQSATVLAGVRHLSASQSMPVIAQAATVDTGAVSGTDVATMTLTSAAVSGTRPVSFGVAFAIGDVPSSFTTDLPNYQVAVMRTWSDGSVKHAIVSGRVALVQNVARTVTFTTGTPPTGTALTATDIATAAPSASVQCGSFGTVNLSSLLASPFRTFISGPEMVECHYRADVGGGTTLAVWFHVRLWADGTVWVRAIVENGFFDNGSGGLGTWTTRSYVPTITINGSVVYNHGGASLSHYSNTRYMAEGWVGTNPQVVPIIDVAYLRDTLLVPNHETAPASAVLTALLQTYTPMDSASHEPDMGATGYHDDIGVLPQWNAAFIASGDARAFKATLVNSSALNSYPIVWRDKTTNLPMRPTDWSTWCVDGNGTGGESNWSAGSLVWEASHFPGDGYLAYLLTGDFWHYETMLLNCAVFYALLTPARGNGVNRFLNPGQIRGTAWALRNMGLVGAIAPDARMVSGTPEFDYRALGINTYNTLHGFISTGPANMVATGCLWAAELYGQWDTDTGWSVTGSIAPWMVDFQVATNGFLSDIECFGASDMVTLDAVRDWYYKWPVGRLGVVGDTAQYPYTDTARYGIKVASTDSDSTWLASWGAIYTASHGSSNSGSGSALNGGNFPGMDSYWGNLQPAIAYAVDDGATGAAAAYSRMAFSSSNWSTLAAEFQNFPVWAVSPRNPPADIPSWLGAVNQWSAAPSSSLTSSGVGWSGTSPNAGLASGNYDTLDLWGTAVIATDGVFRGGSYVSGPHLVVFGGGHNNYGGNEVYAYGPLTNDAPTWARLTDPTIPAADDTSRTGAGKPVSRHPYASLQYSAAAKKMICYGIAAAFHSGGNHDGGDAFDFTVNPGSSNPWSNYDGEMISPGTSAGWQYARSALDENGIYWQIPSGNSSQLIKFDPSSLTLLGNWGVDNPNTFSYTGADIDTTHHIFAYWGDETTTQVCAIDLRTPSSAAVYYPSTTGIAPVNGMCSLAWIPALGKFAGWDNSGKKVYFLTPSASPYAGGTAWAWTSTTPGSGATPSDVVPATFDPSGYFVNNKFRFVDFGSWTGLVLLTNLHNGIYVYRLT